MTTRASKHVDTSAWGDTPPEFIRVLANVVSECGNNAAAARKLGINRASVSTLLANKYPANTQKMEKTIMAWATKIPCPVLGDISAGQCQAERNKPFISSNPLRVQLFRACRKCPRNPSCGEQP